VTLNLGEKRIISKCSEIYPGLLIGGLRHVLHQRPQNAPKDEGDGLGGFYQLREQQASYIANSGHKKATLSDDNTYLWNVSALN
jgi:hypothetical protein